jgi:hypothetical protein
MRAAETTARVVHALALAIWLGALLLLAWMDDRLEPVVGSEHTGQAVVLRGLEAVEQFGLLATPVLLLTLGLGWSGRVFSRRNRALLCLGLGAAVAASRWWIRPQLERVRASMGRPVEALPPTDPSWADYTWALSLTQAVVAIQILVVALLLVAAVRQLRARQTGGIEL